VLGIRLGSFGLQFVHYNSICGEFGYFFAIERICALDAVEFVHRDIHYASGLIGIIKAFKKKTKSQRHLPLRMALSCLVQDFGSKNVSIFLIELAQKIMQIGRYRSL
jgi:hypothetical protein